MNTSQVCTSRRFLAGAVVAVALAVALFGWAQTTAQEASAEDGGERLALNATGLNVTCDAPSEPSECVVPLGGFFTMSAEVIEAPANGYVNVQSFIEYGNDLAYHSLSPSEEILWPDLGSDDVAFRGDGSLCPTQCVNHSALTGLVPPLPTSDYVGAFIEIVMECTASESSTDVELIPYLASHADTDGAVFVEPDGVTQIPSKAHTLTISCEEVQDPQDGTPSADPTATPPSGLPPTGTAGLIPDAETNGDGSNAGLWILIIGLTAAGAAGLALFGFRYARGRRSI